MLFALAHDVTSTDGKPGLRPGKVRLREYKRPRPIVLRVNQGDCLDIRFQNLLTPKPMDPNQPVTRDAGIHVAGYWRRWRVCRQRAAQRVGGMGRSGNGSQRRRKSNSRHHGIDLLHGAGLSARGQGCFQVDDE